MRYYLEDIKGKQYSWIYSGTTLQYLTLRYMKYKGQWTKLNVDWTTEKNFNNNNLKEINIEDFIANHFEDII